MKKNRPRTVLTWAQGVLLLGLWAMPGVLQAADTDALTRALRAKIEELRLGPALPLMMRGAPMTADVEATLRDLVRQKMAEQSPTRSKALDLPGVVQRRPVAEKAGMNMATQPNREIVYLPAGTVVSVPAPAQQTARAVATVSDDPLKALDEQYFSGQISPRAYHEQRAKLTQHR